MVTFRKTQRAFSGGEISPYLHARSDMEIYYGALKSSVNWVTDQFGALHRRPGTQFRAKAKGKPCFYNIDADADCRATIAASPDCFQFFVDGVKFGDDLVTDYGADDYCDLKIADDCGATYIAHPAHPPRIVTKSDGVFQINDLPRLPYGELNKDATCRICLEEGGSAATGTMTLATDEWATGDSVDIIDAAGATVGTVVLGDAIGGNAFEVPFVSGVVTGEYVDQNGDALFVSANGATIKAFGCEPFTQSMVGQYLRVLDEDGSCKSSRLVQVFTYALGPVDGMGNPVGDYDLSGGEYVFVGAGNGDYVQSVGTSTQANEDDKNEPNTWISAQVIDFISETEIVVSYSGCEIKCTDLFCLPAYADGVYPSAVWIHDNRLWLAKENCLVGSAHGDFFNWEKTDPDGSVNPDNAVYTKLGAGKCQSIEWMRTNGRYLIAGTDHGIYAVGGSQGAIAADDHVEQLVQSVGAAGIEPLSIGEDTLFVDRTCTRIYSVAPGVQYDQLAIVEKTIFADHIGEKRFKSLAFQETKFPIVWIVTEDNCLASLTYWPSQNVRGFSRHELGGQLIKSGCCQKPAVCDVQSQRTADGKTDLTYFAVQRTIDGEDVFFIETLGEFFSHYTKKEAAHYLDAALPLKNTVAMPPRAVWSDPFFPSLGGSGLIAICDDDRWHYGVDGPDGVEMTAPNTRCVTYGRTLQEIDGEFVRIEKPKFGEKKAFVGPEACLYDPPCDPQEMAICQETWAGFECFESEGLVVYLDGQDCGCVEVVGGALASEGCVGWAGYPYESEAELLPWTADLGTSDGSGDNSAITGISLNVYRTPSVKAVMDQPDNYHQISEYCSEVVDAESKEVWGVEFATGWHGVDLSGVNDKNDGGGLVIRADGPFPAIIRAIKPRYSVNVGA